MEGVHEFCIIPILVVNTGFLLIQACIKDMTLTFVVAVGKGQVTVSHADYSRHHMKK
jgi:hypothetical protein